MKKIYLSLLISLLFISCQTTKDLEIITATDEEELTEEQLQKDESDGIYLVKEAVQEQNSNENILVIERPVYYPESKASANEKPKSGKEAAVQSLSEAIQKPEQYKSGTFYYQFNENWVYEVYAQPLHLTDIELEPGEIVTSNPLLSENETVWELTAGVARDPETGLQVQHLFVKPAYANLNSTLIIITDRRVYHFNLKSYKDTYMAMVKFRYAGKRNVWAKPEVNETSNYIKTSNPEFLSFDYTTSYSKNNKPDFVPTMVYDDGSFTYIQVDEKVLHSKLPVLFNEKNEIINYEVKSNVFVIPKLITKVSLRIGKEKVIIEKKVKGK